MAWGTLMIIADEPDQLKSLDMGLTAIQHLNNAFSRWGPVFVLAPDYYPYNTIPYRIGPPTNPNIKSAIENNLVNLKKVIYIDDHSNVINGKWKFLDPSTPNDELSFLELKNYLNQDNQQSIIIARGNGSGEPIIDPTLREAGRNIFSSMTDNETLGTNPDNYDVDYATSPCDIERVHDLEEAALSALGIQHPMKYIGIPDCQ